MSAIGLQGTRVVITGAQVAVAGILEQEARATAEFLRAEGHDAIFVAVDLAGRLLVVNGGCVLN